MNNNFIKTKMFHKMNLDLKGHLRSHRVIFVFENEFFFDFYFKSIQNFLR